MNNILHNERGIALVVTLAVVAILVAAALQLGKFTGDSVMVTLIEKDRFQAEQFALSGINLAMFILVEDAAKNKIDSVQETWADPDKLSQVVNGMGLEKEQLTIKITDELSKIQVNALIDEFPGNQFVPEQGQIWENLFAPRFLNDKEIDARDPAVIINCVKDWLDSGDDDAVSGLSGAESDYYKGLDPPYTCANGPFNHISELLNVKGISKDLLEDENLDEIDAPVKSVALGDVFTVYGQDDKKAAKGGFRYPGKININTAGIDVLAALLPEGLEDLAQDLADFREQKSEQGDVFINTLDKEWYKKVIELSDKEQKRFEQTVKYASDTFRVECAASKNNTSITLAAVVKREKIGIAGKWVCRIIQMERK